MALAGRLLTDALERLPRSQGEDRLTEVFAATLESSSRLASWFANRALEALGPSVPLELQPGSYVVRTQVIVGDGRPDMAITFADGAGGFRRVLSEHKIAAGETRAQGGHYTGKRPSDVLVAVVPDGYAHLAGFGRITWAEVARAADRLGRESCGRRWRAHALSAGVAAESRMLAELVSYLERKDVRVAILDPMTSLDVVTYRHARDSLRKARQLLEHAARELDPAASIHERGPANPSRSWYADLGRDRWPFAVDPWIIGELLVSSHDNWVDDPLDEPAFAAGYVVQVMRGRWPEALEESGPVRRALEALDGVTVTDRHEPKRGRIVRTLYLSEVAAHGRDLADQAGYVAGWARSALEQIAEAAHMGRRPS